MAQQPKRIVSPTRLAGFSSPKTGKENMYRKSEQGKTLSEALDAPEGQYAPGTAYYCDSDDHYAAVNINKNGAGTVVTASQSFSFQNTREMYGLLHDHQIDQNSGWTPYDIY